MGETKETTIIQPAPAAVVERVARAICCHGKPCLTPDGVCVMDPMHLELARAALSAQPASDKILYDAAAVEAVQLLLERGKAEVDKDGYLCLVQPALVEQDVERKLFPVLGSRGATVDFQFVADHGKQAQANHYQSVQRLAERGGLSWCELYAVVHNRPWQKMDDNEAIIAVRALEARYLSTLTPARAEGFKAGVEALKLADSALREYACHGGLGVPCLRTKEQCRSDCGKEAGDALLAVEAALKESDHG